MKIFEHLEGLVTGKIKILKELLLLFSLEMRLTKLTLLPLILYVLSFFIALLVSWCIILIIIGYLLTPFCGAMIALFITLTINSVAQLFLLRAIFIGLNRVSFKKTRALYYSSFHKNDT